MYFQSFCTILAPGDCGNGRVRDSIADLFLGLHDSVSLFWDVLQLTLHQSIDFKVLLTLLRQLEGSCKAFL